MAHSLSSLHGTNFLAELMRRADPEATAIRFQGREYAYGYLQDASIRFARALELGGVAPGDYVLVFMANSIEQVLSMIAIQRLGAIVVAAKSTWARSEINSAVTMTGCRFAVTDSIRAPILRSTTCEWARVWVVAPTELGRAETAWALADSPFVDRPTDPRAASIVMFTSGTSGTRKGIVYSSDVVIDTGRVMAEIFPDTRWVCLVKNLTYMPGVARLLMAMHLGIELVLYPEARGMAQILPDLARPGGNIAGVPSEYRALLEAARNAGDVELGKGTILMWGGELMNSATIDAFRDEFQIPIFGFYAASEFFPISSEVMTDGPVCQGSLGKLGPGIEMRLMADGKPVTTPHTPGQAFVRRPVMALNYILPSGGSQPMIDEEGWYDTKDILLFDEDGVYWCQGRIGDRAKRNGIWVALSAITEVITQERDFVDVAFTIVLDPLSGAEFISSFVALHRGAARAAAEAALQRSLRANLASYAIPDQIILVEDIPIAESGKPDRRALERHAVIVREEHPGQMFVDARSG